MFRLNLSFIWLLFNDVRNHSYVIFIVVGKTTPSFFRKGTSRLRLARVRDEGVQCIVSLLIILNNPLVFNALFAGQLGGFCAYSINTFQNAT